MRAAPIALWDSALKPATALADMAAGLRLEAVPEAARHRGKLSILDALGVGLASNAFVYADRALAGISALAGEAGSCSVIGRKERLPVRDAALANGILIHGLDFDDTHLTSIVHPTAACLPCALSLGEALNVDGPSFLTAYMAGMETAVRVGAAVKGGFHHVGFHATGIVAHFSSAVIAAKLLGLSTRQIVEAQGIAASTASGVQVFLEDGAWTKRFHPGWGAVAGITAARLAGADFTGPSRPYEGKFGLFDTHLQDKAGHADLDIMVTDLGTRWHFADTALKPYPVCHFIHGCADAAIELSRSVDWRDIAAVEAFLPKDTMPIVAEPAAAKERPTTDYEAKFSAQFVVATCLIKGRFNLPELQEEALRDPQVRELATRVACSIDSASAFPQFFSGGVKLTLKDGRELFRHIRVNSGAGERALDTESVAAKFMASASLAVDGTKAAAVQEIVLDIENRTVAELTAALRI
ncbi:MmgE/PrpD family protein [Bradyrhizobium sp. LHD-71]|uniref:MmgE/PrpD family protein n=1 Tax=Bradyrhizobium sp. LHD-71 TaxID=3072141 RepID=UPI00280D3822|nr:MmgE/PrpD family protein [Bradyrhizobium sp. LHD-71]MDQ8728288.1 MmgE/PrpD family protein [Bradyrhizobium sp. LHD-71]